MIGSLNLGIGNKKERVAVTISPGISESGLLLLFFRGQGKEWKITVI